MEICNENRSCEIYDLPSEMILRILSYIPAKELLYDRLVCQRFNGIITRNGVKLQRMPCKMEIWLNQHENGIKFLMKIESMSGKNAIELEIDEQQDHYRHALSLLNISHLSIGFTGQQPLDSNEFMANFMQNLILYKQHQIYSFTIKNMNISKSKICFKLFEILSQKYVQDICFENCHLDSEFAPQQIIKMENLCQIRILNMLDTVLIETTNLCLKKFAYDTRYKARRTIPFIVEASTANTDAVCLFMKTWLEISEDIFFKIKLYRVDEEWKNDFLHECNNFRLGHVNLEFPSRSRSSAHIKVKFHPDNSCCEIFPVIDLPAREPGQLVCYARYFRDF